MWKYGCAKYENMKRRTDQIDLSVRQRKNLSPKQNWTHDLLSPGWALYLLSNRKLWWARSFNWVHMWQASCILRLLGIQYCWSRCECGKCIKMVNLSSVMKCEKWTDQHGTNMEKKKKIWVPNRNRTHDLSNIGWVLYPLNYKNSWRARSFNWVQSSPPLFIYRTMTK